MSKIVPPHGGGELNPLLILGEERADELERAKSLTQVFLSSREISDLMMLGMGAYTPLDGFMTHGDWNFE